MESSQEAQQPGPAKHDGRAKRRPRLASWAYLKMQYPELVLGALRAVEAGMLTRAILEDIAGAESRARLEKATWANAPEIPKEALRGLPPRDDAAVPTSGPNSAWHLLRSHVPDPAGAFPDYAPKSLDFKTVSNKQISSSSVWLTANADGKVLASVPPGTPFRVKEIISYDGTLRVDSGLPTVGGGLATRAVRRVWDWRKGPPFELPVRAGQEFRVIVDFAPVFDFFTMPAGNYTSRLDVEGDAWHIKVPITGTLRGLDVAGFVIETDVDELTVATWYPTTDLPVPTKLRIMNIGKAPQTVTLSADVLPPGVTFDGGPRTIVLAGNETRWVNIQFLLSRSGSGEGWHYGFGQVVTLRAERETGDSYVSLGLNIIQPKYAWTWGGAPLGVNVQLAYVIFATGHFQFSRAVVNDSVFPASFAFKFLLDGVEFGNFAGSVDSMFSHGKDFYSYGFYRPEFKSQYGHWVRASAYFWHHVATRL
jgi:hypothetical protein